MSNWIAILIIVIACGIVGHMDYQDAHGNWNGCSEQE